MILIADSGSSKTDWALITGQETQYFKTEGLNPRQKNAEEIVTILKNIVSSVQSKAITKVFFFGAGCSGAMGKQLIKDSVNQVFPHAEVDVQTDLHGAAIGMFGDKRGIAAILGTGSNCGLWDGHTICQQPVSLGYLLGDEGSGYHIGKLLAEFYLKKNMPLSLSQKFEERFAVSPEDLITKMYQQAKPNVFLSGFAVFASENYGDSFIKAVLEESFTLFFRDYISKLSQAGESQIKFTGSISSAFEADIKNVAWKFGCQIAAVRQSPIQGMAEYFQRCL